MIKEPRAMREVHKIQENIYKEYRNLSDQKKLERIHNEAMEAEKKLGLSFRHVK